MEGFALAVVDREEHGRAASIAGTGEGLTALLGHLDEPGDLARTLGMDPRSSPAELAARALDRFAADAPRRMLGEWAAVRWHAPSRTCELVMSEACRDSIYFATDGRRAAISGEMRRLARLDWVGDAIDPRGLMLTLGRARLRRFLTHETVSRGILRAVPGSRTVFRLGGHATRRLPPEDPPGPWRGSFEDALAEIEAVLRRIVGQHLARHGTAVSLMSGGLDSSLLGWLASVERRAGQPLSFLTSVAPDGSGLPDERAESAMVASRLGVPVEFVFPGPEAGPFLPSARIFAHTEMPMASPRHYLYDRLHDAAAATGAEVLLDGVYGELTVTNHLRLVPPARTLRQRLRDVRSRMRALAGERRERRTWPAGLFHARLSRDALALLPSAISEDWAAPYDPWGTVRHGDAWGIPAAAAKNAMTPTSEPGARLRHLMPFRDRRLLRTVAPMPAAFLEHGGLDRALARMLLKERVPDAIRLRRAGKPFSPDYGRRVQAHAAAALGEVVRFRAAGAGEWLDLDWLEQALDGLSKRQTALQADAYEAQATAVAAAFFAWRAGS